MSRVWVVPAAAMCLALPWVPGIPLYWISLLNQAGIAAVLVIGLVVLTGIGGMTSFGQASFLGFGAYTTALLTQGGWSPWLGLPAAVAVTVLAALLIGAVTLRLSGHYLALCTMAWGVSLYYVVANLDLFGRNDGLTDIPPVAVFGTRLIGARLYFPLVWLIVLAACLASWNLLDSRTGRAIRALRGGAVAAASAGVNTTAARLVAFVYAAALAAVAGWLYAHMQRSVSPTPFGLTASIDYLLMAVVGGAAHVPGAVLGAVLITVTNDRLQDILPRLLGAQGNFEGIVFGGLLLVLLQAAPDGLWPRLVRRRAPRPHPLGAALLAARRQAAPGTTLLEVDGLCKSFGGLAAVAGLGFTVRAGEIVGLIGPNGAGKSTSFALLSGLARADAGSIRLAGRSLRGLRPPAIARLGVARSFQHVRLVAAMSVIENVAVGAHLRGRAGPFAALLRRDRREEAGLFAEAARALDRVGLGALADRPAASLALGQQRLVEIARALCADPLLLLLDEPAAGLRHHEKAALAALLARLRVGGLAILLVEHDMGFVMTLADRLVVMDFGTLLAEGPPHTVRHDPAVIAAYLGAA